MKKFKKILALAIAMVMVLAMSVTVFASAEGAESEVSPYEKTTINVTVNGNEHTEFYAIQIFKGNQESTSDGMALTNIDWADSTKAEGLKAAIATVVPAAGSATDASGVAKAISDANLTPEGAEKLAKAIYEVLKNETGTKLTTGATNEVPVGWYLVVDKTPLATATDPEKNDALNAAVLQFTRDITIEKKTDAPSQEKKVKEDTTYTEENGYNDEADYDIGEEVPFQITSKIPDISKYTKYEMTFTDTMDTTLDFTASSIKVTIGNTEYDATAIGSNENIILTPASDGHSFTLKLILKKQNEDKLSGTTTSIFAQDADIKIDFTAKLNKNAVIGLPGNVNKSKLTYTNSPNATDEHDSTSDTPEDKVVVFTYELDVTKVDGADTTKKLKDAEFVLKNADGKFLKVDANGKVEGWVAAQADATTLKTPENGKIVIIGLDEGTYSLVETKAPANYNKLTNPIELKITADYLEDRQNWDGTADGIRALKIEVDGEEKTGNTTTGIVATDVINNAGTVLPSTGGMGTTIFYIVGAVLVIGAGVLLVTRRRMSAQ